MKQCRVTVALIRSDGAARRPEARSEWVRYSEGGTAGIGCSVKNFVKLEGHVRSSDALFKR